MNFMGNGITRFSQMSKIRAIIHAQLLSLISIGFLAIKPYLGVRIAIFHILLNHKALQD